MFSSCMSNFFPTFLAWYLYAFLKFVSNNNFWAKIFIILGLVYDGILEKLLENGIDFKF